MPYLYLPHVPSQSLQNARTSRLVGGAVSAGKTRGGRGAQATSVSLERVCPCCSPLPRAESDLLSLVYEDERERTRGRPRVVHAIRGVMRCSRDWTVSDG